MDRLVERIIQRHPKAVPFALGLQSLLDQGVDRVTVIKMGREALRLERTRLAGR